MTSLNTGSSLKRSQRLSTFFTDHPFAAITCLVRLSLPCSAKAVATTFNLPVCFNLDWEPPNNP
ncbi:hypothetical protein CY34DRAFT_19771 [Suillus luteus UH-Slu-Lm8-n1]|uniref:Uncharacterized protein n=1 Tax=Suillus luteus UH-Slu-Lm8-n1 TaxID=930992 RepID=A0A0C9Z2A7_9AGAM|nr:hypothetical protein CY34DRAFT_19771 [Suillus luteus UH-Slu-Lm8-n1]